MILDMDLLVADFISHLWPLIRVAGMLMTMVVFSAKAVPARVRVLASLAFTLLLLPVLPAMPQVDPLTLGHWLISVQQLLIGIALGFVSLLVMQTFVLAGQVIAMQAGLGFAAMVDPNNGQNTPVVGQFYLLLATLLFLETDGHLVMIQLVASSFDSLPVSAVGLVSMDFQALAAWFGQLFAAALALSLSSIGAMLLINFSFGVMTRAAPQLNIFSLGFSISMLAGLLVLWLTLRGFLDHFTNQWQQGVSLMCQLVKQAC